MGILDRFGRRNQCSLKNKASSKKYLNLDTSHERSVVLFELLTGSERKKCRPGHAARGRGGRSSSGRTRRSGWGRCGRCRSLKWKRMIWPEKAIGRSWCYCSIFKDCPGGAGVGGQTWDFLGFVYLFSLRKQCLKPLGYCAPRSPALVYSQKPLIKYFKN